MNHTRRSFGKLTRLGWASLVAFALVHPGLATETNTPVFMRTHVGVTTNGPFVFELFRQEPAHVSTVWTNPALARLRERRAVTNRVFREFIPGSLNHHVWTNVMARTNRRTMPVWATRTHPPDWPTNPPSATWNTNSLIWGLKGATAISPCWELEVWPGQIPITALTRRHGYTRGHGMGPDGFRAQLAGRKVWFVTTNNQVVTAVVAREVVRTRTATSPRDYAILLFDRDLPPGIQPIRVVSSTNLALKFPVQPEAPCPVFKTEQGGNVSAEIVGFTVPTWKGGDSGSPNMLPLPGELVFISGRSTTGPTLEMQSDMDELCRLQKLDPQRHQLQWVDLSEFPDYQPGSYR